MCDKCYLGETICRLEDRIKEHKSACCRESRQLLSHEEELLSTSRVDAAARGSLKDQVIWRGYGLRVRPYLS